MAKNGRGVKTKSRVRLPDFVVGKCTDFLKKNITMWGRNADTGTYFLFTGNKKGTWTYANRQAQVIETVTRQFDLQSKKCLWLTLTDSYDYTSIEGIAKSFVNIKEKLTKFFRQKDKLHIVKYMWVLEAHGKGGAHAHALVELDRTVNYYQGKKGILRLADLPLRAAIKAAWGGNSDIQVVYSGRVANYLTKELGKGFAVENSLKRIKEGRPAKNDVNRIWAYYFMAVASAKQNRAFGTSKNIKRQNALILNSNKSTEDSPETAGIDHVDEFFVLPVSISKRADFMPYTGNIPIGSWLHNELDRIYSDMIKTRQNFTEGIGSLTAKALAA